MIDCGAGPLPLVLGADTPGNHYSATSPAPPPFAQVQTFFGAEGLLSASGVSLSKLYFSAAFGLAPGQTLDCSLSAQATASDGALDACDTPTGAVYPVLKFSFPSFIADGAFACAQHALDAVPGTAVHSDYTSMTAPASFDFFIDDGADGATLTSCGSTPPPPDPECGDGTIDPNEVCDDGPANTDAPCTYGDELCDLCTLGCQPAAPRYCGDGVVQALDEVCDDGPANTSAPCAYGDDLCDLCTLGCQPATPSYCGDGVVQAPEEACDGAAPDCASISASFEPGPAACVSCQVVTTGCVPVTVPEDGTVLGNVFRDDDGDRVLGANEVALSGVTIELQTLDGTIIATDVTDESGDYLFLDVPPGTYHLLASDGVPDALAFVLPDGTPRHLGVLVVAGQATVRDFVLEVGSWVAVGSLTGVLYVEHSDDYGVSVMPPGPEGYPLNHNIYNPARTDTCGTVPCNDFAGYQAGVDALWSTFRPTWVERWVAAGSYTEGELAHPIIRVVGNGGTVRELTTTNGTYRFDLLPASETYTVTWKNPPFSGDPAWSSGLLTFWPIEPAMSVSNPNGLRPKSANSVSGFLPVDHPPSYFALSAAGVIIPEGGTRTLDFGLLAQEDGPIPIDSTPPGVITGELYVEDFGTPYFPDAPFAVGRELYDAAARRTCVSAANPVAPGLVQCTSNQGYHAGVDHRWYEIAATGIGGSPYAAVVDLYQLDPVTQDWTWVTSQTLVAGQASYLFADLDTTKTYAVAWFNPFYDAVGSGIAEGDIDAPTWPVTPGYPVVETDGISHSASWEAPFPGLARTNITLTGTPLRKIDLALARATPSAPVIPVVDGNVIISGRVFVEPGGTLGVYNSGVDKLFAAYFPTAPEPLFQVTTPDGTSFVTPGSFDWSNSTYAVFVDYYRLPGAGLDLDDAIVPVDLVVTWLNPPPGVTMPWPYDLAEGATVCPTLPSMSCDGQMWSGAALSRAVAGVVPGASVVTHTRDFGLFVGAVVCGNGAVEPGEQCDGSLGGATCQSLGFVTGSLTCQDCRFDTSGCSTVTTKRQCGNGALDPGEECDPYHAPTCAEGELCSPAYCTCDPNQVQDVPGCEDVTGLTGTHDIRLEVSCDDACEIFLDGVKVAGELVTPPYWWTPKTFTVTGVQPGCHVLGIRDADLHSVAAGVVGTIYIDGVPRFVTGRDDAIRISDSIVGPLEGANTWSTLTYPEPLWPKAAQCGPSPWQGIWGPTYYAFGAYPVWYNTQCRGEHTEAFVRVVFTVR